MELSFQPHISLCTFQHKDLRHLKTHKKSEDLNKEKKILHQSAILMQEEEKNPTAFGSRLCLLGTFHL